MAEATWEKTARREAVLRRHSGGRLKFLIGGLLIVGAIAYLIVSGTLAGAQFFITVDEVVGNPEYVGKTVRLSGVVLGDTIEYDSENLVIDFTIAHIPTEFNDLAEALHAAANNPDATRLQVHIENEVKPDLLQHEAQAILTGTLGEDGTFYATELLLKCPSRFIESGPEGSEVQPEQDAV